jgi:hypothetical protein
MQYPVNKLFKYNKGALMPTNVVNAGAAPQYGRPRPAQNKNRQSVLRRTNQQIQKDLN